MPTGAVGPELWSALPQGAVSVPGHLVVWFLALRDRFHDDFLSIYSVLDSSTNTPHPVLRPALGSRCSSLMDKEMEIQEG